VKKRSHVLPLVLLAIFSIASIAAYGFHTALAHPVMERSEISSLQVEVVHGSGPTNLKITIEGAGISQRIRSVTLKRQGNAVDVLYRMAKGAGEAQGQDWHEPYLLAIPDSVQEVRFGRNKDVIWHRPESN
jgi:hypothetical protein